MIAGALVPFVVPYFASLREAYPTQPGWQIAPQLIWVASWLVGWEFLHRYALLRAVERAWPRWGWLWVPASEFIFHLQKPLLEALGMLAFSLLATTWARRRRSILLPLAVHFAIEAGLALLQAGY
jgi:membrane protease YdiL (CAAX protease family)